MLAKPGAQNKTDFSSYLQNGVFKMEHINDDAYPELFAFLEDNQKKITAVEISHNDSLDNSKILLLAAILADMPKLTELKLNDNKLNDTAAKYISMLLDAKPSLSKVDLANNKIGQNGAVAIAHAVRNRPDLEVNLRMNDIGKNPDDNIDNLTKNFNR